MYLVVRDLYEAAVKFVMNYKLLRTRKMADILTRNVTILIFVGVPYIHTLKEVCIHSDNGQMGYWKYRSLQKKVKLSINRLSFQFTKTLTLLSNLIYVFVDSGTLSW
jgi:hypothetical protein